MWRILARASSDRAWLAVCSPLTLVLLTLWEDMSAGEKQGRLDQVIFESQPVARVETAHPS